MTEWRAVKGFEGKYEVSACGRVRRCARLILRSNGHPYRTTQMELAQVAYGHSREYKGVGLKVKPKTNHVKLVHRLVAEAFIPNPKGLKEVNHLNLDKHDNRVENLEWTTKTGNQAHAAKRGRFHGLTNPNARFKLQPVDVLSIREDIRLGGKTLEEIGARHGVSGSMIGHIKHGRSWADPAEVFAHAP